MIRSVPIDTPSVFRVVLNRLTADGKTVYSQQAYGPYPTRRSARAIATRVLSEESTHGRKIRVFVQEAKAEWHDLDAHGFEVTP